MRVRLASRASSPALLAFDGYRVRDAQGSSQSTSHRITSRVEERREVFDVVRDLTESVQRDDRATRELVGERVAEPPSGAARAF